MPIDDFLTKLLAIQTRGIATTEFKIIIFYVFCYWTVEINSLASLFDIRCAREKKIAKCFFLAIIIASVYLITSIFG